jgi:tetratricopeptide (TPR) repeat protein
MNFATILKTALLLGAFALVAPDSADAARSASERAKEQREAKKGEKEKAAPLFPNATRPDPKIKPVSSLSKQLQKLFDLSEEQKNEEALAVADEIIAHKKAGAYERSLAYQAKGFVYVDMDDYGKALPLLQKSLDENGLPNDTHYQIMNQIGQMQMSEENYAEALATFDKFLAETKSEKPDYLAMKGNALYRLERYDEAAQFLQKAIDTSDKPQESWNQLLMATYFDQDKPMEAARIAEQLVAKNPTDKKMLMNLSSIYAEADQYDKAIEVLERARSAGLLTEERDYRQLFALYLNTEGKEAKGIEVINEGLDKGILKPSAETYIALGQAYYFTDKLNESIDAYKKALPLAKDGEPALNLSRVLTNEERYAEAKAAAQEALKKGVKRPGDAWMVIGRSEFGLNNRPGLIAAYKEAAKYPETKQQAEEWLKKNGSK